MAVAIQGSRGVDSQNQTLRKIDMRDKIDLIRPKKQPLTILTKKVGKEVVKDPMFQWASDVLGPRWDRVPAAQAAGATPLNVTNGDYFHAFDIILIPRTNERMLVTGVVVNALGVTRAWGGSPGAATIASDLVVIIGSAFAEGSAMATPRMTTPQNDFNYLQIHKDVAESTGTAEAMETWGNDSLDRQTDKAGEEHVIGIERAHLFGIRARVAGALPPHETRTTGGVDWFIAANGQNFNLNGAPLTEIELMFFFENLFKFTDSVTMFTPPNFQTAVSLAVRFHMEPIANAQKALGFPVYELTTPHGMVRLVPHPLLEGPVHSRYAVALTLEDLKYRFAKGRDNTLELDVLQTGVDAQQNQWLTECGLELRKPVEHGKIYGWS